MTIIHLSEHPSNLDPTARLTNETVRMGTTSIYRVKGGFLACLPDYQCLSGLYGSESDAKLAQQQIAEARKLGDDDVRRHASIATDNGPFDENDASFTTACELVRRERGLPHLHEEDDA